MNIATHFMGRISLVCLAVLTLSACTTLENFAHQDEDVNEVEVLNYYDPRYYDSDYDQLATEMSNDQIKVYGLEGNMREPLGAPAVRTSSTTPRTMPARGVVANDPSVTVFPFDDNSYPSAVPSSQPYPRPTPAKTGWSGEPINATPMPLPTRMTQNAQPSLYPVQAADSMAPNRIYFAHDSKEVTPSGKKVIDHIAKGYNGQNISVEGHASSRAEQNNTIERKITNLRVSMNRALNVSRELMKDGVPAESIETKAYGDTRPPLVSVGMDPEAAARRVEVFSR